MHVFKNYIALLLFLIHPNFLTPESNVQNTEEIRGFYANLSNEEKMHLLIGSLDKGLLFMLSNYQTNKNVAQLAATMNVGIEKYKTMMYDIDNEMHVNIMYLHFLEYSYYLCKYGQTADFLETLTTQERTEIFTVCYEQWLIKYNVELNANLAFLLNDLTEHFSL